MPADKNSPDEIMKRVKKSTAAINQSTQQIEMELVHFQEGSQDIEFNLDVTAETVWATQQQMAELFDINVPAVSKHIANIYADGELSQKATLSKMERVQVEGGRNVSRQIEHYNLDMILSVGYRVSSAKATRFRQWATQTLRAYIVDGFALNERRLRDDPNALRDLAARVRELRSSELNIYKSVRDVFAFGSTDYDGQSQAARTFYAKLQDKFTFAVTGRQSAEIVLERADHREFNMGLKSMKGEHPSHADISTGKNYLDENELYSLHILCEQFLLFVESWALRGKKLTMQEMADKFDELLSIQGHPVFKEYKTYLAQKAKDHATRELEQYRDRQMALPHDQRDAAIMAMLKSRGVANSPSIGQRRNAS